MWLTQEPAASRKLYLPLGILGDVGEETLQWEDRVEFRDLGKHAPSLSPALGKQSLLLLQWLQYTLSLCFMAPIPMWSGKFSVLQSHKPGFCKTAKEQSSV